MVRYATSILKDKEAAKEAAQECFLRLLEQNQAEVKDRVQSWLYRECRNRAIDIWRKSRKTEPLKDDFDETVSFADSNPLEALETSASVKKLRAEIQKLSPRHQEALWLKYNDGLSYKQIAEVMNLSATNVGFILYEAVKSLRETTIELESPAEPPVQRKYGE